MSQKPNWKVYLLNASGVDKPIYPNVGSSDMSYLFLKWRKAGWLGKDSLCGEKACKTRTQGGTSVVRSPSLVSLFCTAVVCMVNPCELAKLSDLLSCISSTLSSFLCSLTYLRNPASLASLIAMCMFRAKTLPCCSWTSVFDSIAVSIDTDIYSMRFASYNSSL